MAKVEQQTLDMQKRLAQMVEVVKVQPMTAREIAKAIGVSDSTARAYVTRVPELRAIRYVSTDRSYAAVYAVDGDAITLEEYLSVTGLDKEVEARNLERTRQRNQERDRERIALAMIEIDTRSRLPLEVRKRFKHKMCSVVCYEGKIYRRDAA
jgi:DNA-binding transcriptional regulator LsrR (DeoR family)